MPIVVHPGRRRWLAVSLALLASGARADEPSPSASPTPPTPPPLAAEFEQAVSPRLAVPADAARAYAVRLAVALNEAGVRDDQPRFVLLVDRSPQVQALLLYWGSAGTAWQLVGATPVSTGLPGRYEHFATPLGVFEHSLFNPDFRAEGTKNDNGIRGYGRQGMRVFDFGWVAAPKGWGDHAVSTMRLQLHATDPDLLERRLGTAQSKGCVRIPATLNDFLDRHGVIDDDYLQAQAEGHKFWVLRRDATPTPWAGRHLVVIDSQASERPAWSPAPKR